MTLIFLVVPSLQVEVSFNTGRFISEGMVVLFCTITLPSTVNSREEVTTTWLGPSGQIGNSSSLVISNVYEVSDGVLQSNVTISSYVPSINNGEYTCTATLTSSSSYVTGNSGSDRRRVAITG